MLSRKHFVRKACLSAGWRVLGPGRRGGRKFDTRHRFRRRGLPFTRSVLICPVRLATKNTLLCCVVRLAARQRAVMDNAAWITPITAKNMDNSKSYRYRDPAKRRAQCAEAMKRYRARKKAAVGVD